jgi:hypothetical protein
MRGKAITGLIVIASALIIIEYPAGTFVSAESMHQPADLILFLVPEPPDATIIAMLLPELCIDMSRFVQGSDQVITMPSRTGGRSSDLVK